MTQPQLAVWEFGVPKPPDRDKGVFTVGAPTGAKVLGFGVHEGRQRLWMLVQGGQRATRLRRFIVVGNGHLFPKDTTNLIYIGTDTTGIDVWHLFEMKSRGTPDPDDEE